MSLMSGCRDEWPCSNIPVRSIAHESAHIGTSFTGEFRVCCPLRAALFLLRFENLYQAQWAFRFPLSLLNEQIVDSASLAAVNGGQNKIVRADGFARPNHSAGP